ncbi:MAG: transposase [Accumulibacter sp.]
MPHLLDDIKAIVDGQSQTDPQFRNQRLDTWLSVKEVRRQLIVQKHSADEELPKQEALRLRLKRLGYSPRMVAKTRPLKKIPQTQALDHDFQPEARVTPVGIFVPEHDDLHLFAVTTKVTSDGLADCLETFGEEQRHCFPEVNTRLLNLDNGPECHSRRTPFMARMVAFVEKTGLTIRLAYYPPYHSKYNLIERCWGILEHHWNGGLLDSIDAVLGYASSMTWKGKHPLVRRMDTAYEMGVKLTKEAMHTLETKIQRLLGVEKWFVDIQPSSVTLSTG